MLKRLPDPTVIDDLFFDEWTALSREFSSNTGHPFKAHLDETFDMVLPLLRTATAWDTVAASEKETHMIFTEQTLTEWIALADEIPELDLESDNPLDQITALLEEALIFAAIWDMCAVSQGHPIE